MGKPSKTKGKPDGNASRPSLKDLWCLKPQDCGPPGTRNFSTLMPPARLCRNTWQQGSFTSQWGPKSNIPWVNHLKQRGSLMEMHPDPHSKTYDALNLKNIQKHLRPWAMTLKSWFFRPPMPTSVLQFFSWVHLGNKVSEAWSIELWWRYVKMIHHGGTWCVHINSNRPFFHVSAICCWPAAIHPGNDWTGHTNCPHHAQVQLLQTQQYKNLFSAPSSSSPTEVRR